MSKSDGTDIQKEAARQLRDLTGYMGKLPGEKKKKEPAAIESYADIVENKPSTKRVREYYAGVLSNIALQQQDFEG